MVHSDRAVITVKRETYERFMELAKHAGHQRQDATLTLLLDAYERSGKPSHTMQAERDEWAQQQVDETLHTLLEQLPVEYPPATLSRDAKGYRLEIDRIIIFQGASGEDAIRHTKHYVEARAGHPDLPVGVIYGVYD